MEDRPACRSRLKPVTCPSPLFCKAALETPEAPRSTRGFWLLQTQPKLGSAEAHEGQGSEALAAVQSAVASKGSFTFGFGGQLTLPSLSSQPLSARPPREDFGLRQPWVGPAHSAAA